MDAGGPGSSGKGSAQGRDDGMRNTSPDPPRILIAEQDQSVAEFLFAFLKDEGYALSLASSPQIALERMDEQTFHLVITDLFVENPRHPFHQVRRLLQHALPTPVGLMTGWPIPPEATRSQGFAFLLPKPFDLDQMLAEIAACLERKLTPEQERQLKMLERFMELLPGGNLNALEQLLTEDVTYYPSQRVRLFSAKRIRGRAALLAYSKEISTRYENVIFDEFLFYPRPKGVALRFRSDWPLPNGTRRSLTGTLVVHFRGEQIHQIRAHWNNERQLALLPSPL